MRRNVARWIAVVAAAALGGACGQDFDPPSLVNKLRVIGAKATPPEIRLTEPSSVSLLVVGAEQTQKLCSAWTFCPFAWSKDGRFACIDPDVQVDLGTAATATVTILHVFQSLQNAPKVFDKLGLKLPTGATSEGQKPDLGCFPGGIAPQGGMAGPGFGSFAGSDIADMYILFQVGYPDQYGGTCPTDATKIVDVPCPDRSRCIAGYKRLAIAVPQSACAPFDPAAEKPCPKDPQLCAQNVVCGCDGKNYANDCTRIAFGVAKRNDGRCASANDNPKLAGVGLRLAAADAALPKGVDWPADATPAVGEGTVLQLWPRFDAKDKQVIGPSQDPKATKPDTESLVFSWYTTAGSMEKERSYDDVPENNWTAPVVPAGKSDLALSIWIVVRDGRNGTDWIERRVRVVKAGASTVNPLCALGVPCKGR